MSKHAGGRPVVYTKKRIEEIVKAMEEYTETNAVPIAAEFAYLHKIRKATLYEIPELAYSLKEMMLKKEFQLEKLGLSGKAPVAMVAFSLKQMGWSDKQEIKHSGEIAGSTFTFVEAPKNSGNTDT